MIITRPTSLLLTALFLTMTSLLSFTASASEDGNEIFCSIRDNGINLNCQWIKGFTASDRKSMTPDDISIFIDKSMVQAYLTVKSKKGMERTFLVDANFPGFRRLAEMKKSASISEIYRAKLDLFAEIEKKSIKVSGELDDTAQAAVLIKVDPSIGREKFRQESRDMSMEVASLRSNRDKLCTSTPAFEQISRANQHLQRTLSNLLQAFQTPQTCLVDEFKVFRDADGSVDLRQLDRVPQLFVDRCKRVASKSN